MSAGDELMISMRFVHSGSTVSSSPLPTGPGPVRVPHHIAQVGQARLAVGESWRGGAKSTTVTVTPLPNPPPQGGRELERTGPRMLGCLTIEYGSKLFADPEALADSTVARMSTATSGNDNRHPGTATDIRERQLSTVRAKPDPHVASLMRATFLRPRTGFVRFHELLAGRGLAWSSERKSSRASRQR